MKKSIVVLLLLSSLTANAIEQDKVMHFGVTFMITGFVFGVLSADKTCTASDYGLFNRQTTTCKHNIPWLTRASIALAIGLLPGLGKELFDQKSYGKFDWEDMGANALGAASAITLFSF